MRFKSVKLFSESFIEVLRPIGVIAALAVMPAAEAVITITPTNGGSISGAQSAGGRIYYLATNGNTLTLPATAFKTFEPLNLATSLSSVPGPIDSSSNYQNMIRVNVSTSQALSLTGTQQAVITFFANPAGTTQHLAPIAEVNGVKCIQNSGSAGCVASGWSNPAGGAQTPNDYYYGAILPANGATVSIGFYLADLCYVLNRDTYTPTPMGCTGSSVSAFSASSMLQFQLSFSIVTAASSDPNTSPNGAAIDSMSVPLNFYFESTPASFTCPAKETLNRSYLPGDGQIFLNSALFGLPSGQAPLASLVAVGKLGDNDSITPITGSNYAAPGSNDLISKVPIGTTNAPVTGFINSTPGNLKSYMLSFIAQDAAGVYIGPSTASACLMGPVAAANIQGFLPSQTNNCFIATATYRSPDSPPVVLLRRFRDQILLKHSLGSEFVEWYYSWSPEAAEWLNQHSFFRFPMLLLLSPLEVIAFLCLHPVWLLLFVGSATLTGVFLVGLMRWNHKGNSNAG